MTNPLIAERTDSTTGYSGIPLVESTVDTGQAIANGNWAAGVIGLAGTALDVAATVLDPFGAIFAAGVGWLIEHVEPLSEALDALTGDPDQIHAHAETWKNVAAELGEVGTDLTSMIAADTAAWTGKAADGYRSRGSDTANLITAAQNAASGVSNGVQMAGEVVTAVRNLVRDIIAELVGHLVSWALQVVFTLGIGLAWVVPQVTAAVAKTANQIASICKKLVGALQKLSPLLKKLGTSFDDVMSALRKLKVHDTPAPPSRSPVSSRGLDPPTTRSTAPDGPTSPASTGTRSPSPEPEGPPTGQRSPTPEPTPEPSTRAPDESTPDTPATGGTQPPVDQWPSTSLPEGTKVYHSTQFNHAQSIHDNGIRPAPDPTQPVPPGQENRWGGGELGGGFYTHRDRESAENYVEWGENDIRVTMEYETVRPLDGRVRPEEIRWLGDVHDMDYRQAGPFISKPTDPNEIKFHNGADDLRLSGVWMNGTRYDSYDAYLGAREDQFWF